MAKMVMNLLACCLFLAMAAMALAERVCSELILSLESRNGVDFTLTAKPQACVCIKSNKACRCSSVNSCSEGVSKGSCKLVPIPPVTAHSTLACDCHNLRGGCNCKSLKGSCQCAISPIQAAGMVDQVLSQLDEYTHLDKFNYRWAADDEDATEVKIKRYGRQEAAISQALHKAGVKSALKKKAKTSLMTKAAYAGGAVGAMYGLHELSHMSPEKKAEWKNKAKNAFKQMTATRVAVPAKYLSLLFWVEVHDLMDDNS